MTRGAMVDNTTAETGAWRQAGWFACACLVTLIAYLASGTPLYYFDTGGYLAQGEKMFRVMGLLSDAAPAPDAGTLPTEAGTANAELAPDDGAVQGNRSAVYSGFLSAIHIGAGLWLVPVLQSMILILAVFLPARIAARATGHPILPMRMAALALAAGAFGAAPFYTAYLMPDIFAPILILSVATLAAFMPRIRLWEALLLVGLGAGSVLMHPSHLGIAILLVPGAAVIAILFRTGRWWLSTILALVIAGAGLVERLAFTVAVEKVAQAEVTYLPFITARLIADGPGKAYLDEVCPNADIATCKLNEMLVRPRQMTATHIIFETTEELGSFQLLPIEDKKQITGEQRMLLEGVLTTRPLSIIWSVLKNTFFQTVRIRVDQTVPDQWVYDRTVAMAPDFPPEYQDGRLPREYWFLDPLTGLHILVYLIAAGVVITWIVRPGSGLDRHARAFGVLLILGILANAVVCGAVSQPADRYGARVIFLLPVLAVFLLFLRHASNHPPLTPHAAR